MTREALTKGRTDHFSLVSFARGHQRQHCASAIIASVYEIDLGQHKLKANTLG